MYESEEPISGVGALVSLALVKPWPSLVLATSFATINLIHGQASFHHKYNEPTPYRSAKQSLLDQVAGAKTVNQMPQKDLRIKKHNSLIPCPFGTFSTQSQQHYLEAWSRYRTDMHHPFRISSKSSRF